LERTAALAEDVDDILAAVGTNLVGVADRFGQLGAGVSAFQSKDFAHMFGRVQAALLVGAGFAPSCQQNTGWSGFSKSLPRL